MFLRVPTTAGVRESFTKESNVREMGWALLRFVGLVARLRRAGHVSLILCCLLMACRGRNEVDRQAPTPTFIAGSFVRSNGETGDVLRLNVDGSFEYIMEGDMGPVASARGRSSYEDGV
jgi:hypothetical protein